MSENGNKEASSGLSFAERLANSFSYRMNSFASQRRERHDRDRYLQSGKRPFAPGYHDYKWNFIQHALADAPLLERFRRGDSLPERYGFRLDERAVEYPWLMSRLSKTGTLLDAGSVLNFEQLIDLPLLKDRTVHVVTLAPEANCFWKRGVSYAFADLRDLPLRDSFYDDIVCLSTLEHVGLNNEIYTSEALGGPEAGDYALAGGELWRVLKPGGHLYLTVPFGKPCQLDWLQQFDAQMCRGLLEKLHPSAADTVYYKYEPTGWNVSTERACANAEYTDPARWGVGLSQQSHAEVDPTVSEETPAAAGAVACIDLVK